MVRLKSRYLICQVLSGHVGGDYDKSISSRDIQSKLLEVISENHGAFGLAHDCKLVYLDPLSGIVCFRTNREFEKEVHFALTCIGSLNGGSPAVVRCLQSCGSLRTFLVALWETLARHVDSRSTLKQTVESVEATAVEKQRYLNEIRGVFAC